VPLHPPLVVLFGLRGSGKSTVGPLLAASLQTPFVDLDPLTALELGEATPADALRKHGEPAFRAAEVRAFAHLLRLPTAVIALGGGTPTAPGFSEVVTARADLTLVYLRATPDTLRTRLSKTDAASRPSLTGTGMLMEIDAVFTARDPLYRSRAQIEIAVDGLTEADVADRIVSELASRRRTS